jgi:hypothetical protein
VPINGRPTLSSLVHSRKQKLAALYNQIARQAGQPSSEFYDFFVALYRLFLPSHRYGIKQNRSCQLLLNVRMQYGCFTQCQRRIKSLISFQVSDLLAELYVKYKFISDVVKWIVWYDTWLGSYNSSDGRFESTPVTISVVFIYLFTQHLAEYNRATVPVLIKFSITLSLYILQPKSFIFCLP